MATKRTKGKKTPARAANAPAKKKRPATVADSNYDLAGNCVDFSQLAPTSGLPNPYTQSGITFLQLNGRDPQKIIATGAGPALAFSETGLAITFASAVNRVKLRVGAFAGKPVTVVAYTKSGNPIMKVAVPPGPGFTSVEISDAELSIVLLTEGNNEGALAIACAYLAVTP